MSKRRAGLRGELSGLQPRSPYIFVTSLVNSDAFFYFLLIPMSAPTFRKSKEKCKTLHNESEKFAVQ